MQPKMPNWNDLRIFLEVYRAGTLSGAAVKLKVDDSTISRHIAQMELALGAPVFDRDQHGFRITPRGQELLEYVEKMEVNAILLSDVIGGARRTPSGPVRIATMEGLASLYLSTQFIDLHNRHPQIAIELVTSTQMVNVNRREADLFISFFPPEGKGLCVEPVGAFPLHLYAAPDYLARHGTPQHPDDLVQHEFVSYVGDLIQLDSVRWLEQAIAFPKVVFQSTSMIAQLFAAADGGGIVMLPSFSRAERFGLVRLLDGQFDVKRTVWLTIRDDLRHIPRIKVVVAFLLEVLKRDCPLPPGVSAPATC